MRRKRRGEYMLKINAKRRRGRREGRYEGL